MQRVVGIYGELLEVIIGRNDKVVWVPVVVVVVGLDTVVVVVGLDTVVVVVGLATVVVVVGLATVVVVVGLAIVVVVVVVVCDPAVVDEVPVKYKYNCFLIKRMVFEF